ncbi:unnamed protein product [Enterobius vermicularis]|uniref:SGS domain-containing protein n=1 Tax=Enterobius vermicularis TaxID=51028 RepID=A0A0N4UZR1_ENTVE|nr:unnamed protein product [Enterobius vermicularis]
MGRGSKRIKSDWANASAALNEAEAFKNKLLAADADRQVADEDTDVDENFYSQFNMMMYSEVERKGFAFALEQPVASLLALGIRR